MAGLLTHFLVKSSLLLYTHNITNVDNASQPTLTALVLLMSEKLLTADFWMQHHDRNDYK